MTPVPRSRVPGQASEEAISVRQRTCQDCDQPGEFHPYMFCVLKKAGRPNPWEDLRWVNERLLGVSLPLRPPAVRNLPLEAFTERASSSPDGRSSE